MAHEAAAGDPHRGQPVLERGRALTSAAAAVVLLHGRGASAEDILSVADEFELPEVAYLAPEAAKHTWYPYSFLTPIEQNQPWLDSALRCVAEVVKRAMDAGIARDKIVLAGFSQGACLASEFVARNPTRYGGLIAYTGGLIGPPGTKFAYSGKLDGMPCLVASGDPDPHVPWKRVQETATALSALGGAVDLRHYPGLPHTISQEEVALGRQLLSMVLTGEH
jgi:predicted esterase